jgi:hypothetical protein
VGAYKIIVECFKKTGKSNIYHHVFFHDSKLSDTFKPTLRNVIEQNSINVTYLSITNTPDDDDLKLFNHENHLYGDRNPNIKNKPIYKGNRNEFYNPLVNCNKKQIRDLYLATNSLDWLFPLTVSCEESEIPGKHCGNCWWCEERIWAFGKL